MRQHFLSILVFLIALTVFSQETPSYRGWSFGYNFSPESGYRKLSAKNNSVWEKLMIDQRESYEVPTLIFTSGFSAEYRCSKIIGLRTGLMFTQRGVETDPEAQKEYYKRRGFIFAESIKARYRYNYFEIPINVAFYILNKPRIQVFGSLGAGLDLLLYSSIRYEDYTTKETKLKSYNRINTTLLGTIGIDYKLNNAVKLRFEPNYRRSMLPLNHSDVIGYYYNMGVNLGVIYSLK